jgi:NAD(P)-dependent dehydrogenase (short-subunit alcohol dehydrogenase family)
LIISGICINKPAEEMSVEEWDSVMNINLKGVFLCCQAEVKVMIPKKYGKIINTASISGSIVNHPQPQVKP